MGVVRFIVVAMVVAVVVGCASPPPVETLRAPAFPFLWEVTGDRPGTIYLLGSIHVRSARYPELDEAVWSALESADELLVEVDTSALSPGDVEQVGAKVGGLLEGRRLRDEVSAETYRDFQAKLREYGLSSAPFERMSPWMASLTLSAVEMKRQGLDFDLGVDQMLIRRANELGVPVGQLESVERQFRVFSEQSDQTQENILRGSVRAGDDVAATANVLHTAYVTGDVERIEQTIGRHRGESLGAFHSALLDDRNLAMRDGILPYLERSQQTLVVVGVGHVVGGNGLVELLRAEGLSVEPVLARGWREHRWPTRLELSMYRDDRWGFEAKLGAAPTVFSPESGDPGEGPISFAAETGLLAFGVNLLPVPAQVDRTNPAIRKQVLASVGSLWGQQLEAELLERNEGRFAGQDALHLILAGDRAVHEGYLFWDGDRLIQVLAIVMGPDGRYLRERAAPRIADFFDSFRVL